MNKTTFRFTKDGRLSAIKLAKNILRKEKAAKKIQKKFRLRRRETIKRKKAAKNKTKKIRETRNKINKDAKKIKKIVEENNKKKEDLLKKLSMRLSRENPDYHTVSNSSFNVPDDVLPPSRFRRQNSGYHTVSNSSSNSPDEFLPPGRFIRQNSGYHPILHNESDIPNDGDSNYLPGFSPDRGQISIPTFTRTNSLEEFIANHRLTKDSGMGKKTQNKKRKKTQNKKRKKTRNKKRKKTRNKKLKRKNV